MFHSPIARLTCSAVLAAGLLLSCAPLLVAQESVEPAAAEGRAAPDDPAVPQADDRDSAEEVAESTQQKVSQIAEQVDQSATARDVSAGILNPIYKLAEHLSFSTFHWIAFAIMATGVVNYALQLVLGKLVLLTKLGFSLTEIFSDALGLVISLIGLVLTTQAAAENSTFTQSPAAVLSASVVGLIGGYVFYRWGQAHELQAAAGRSAQSRQGEKRSGTATRLN